MEVIDFNKQNSILNQFIAEIRDVNIQKDQMRFRRNLERIGEIMALEVSKKLNYVTKEVITLWVALPSMYQRRILYLVQCSVQVCRCIRASITILTIARTRLYRLTANIWMR